MPGAGVRLELAAVCCSLQGLFITPEEMFELKSGLEAGLAALQLGGAWLCCPPGWGWGQWDRVGSGGCLACPNPWAVLSLLWCLGCCSLLWGDGGTESDPVAPLSPLECGCESTRATDGATSRAGVQQPHQKHQLSQNSSTDGCPGLPVVGDTGGPQPGDSWALHPTCELCSSCLSS